MTTISRWFASLVGIPYYQPPSIAVHRPIAIVFCVVTSLLCGGAARGDIFRWDNMQLIPGTEGIALEPGVFLDDFELSFADLRQADVTFGSFESAILTDADLTGAQVGSANFFDSTLSKEQLYSTASYQNHDLSGIRLGPDLSGWDFSGQNLTGADFFSTQLAGAILTDAAILGASFQSTVAGGLSKEQVYSTASYQQHNLQAVDLSDNALAGWDFTNQDLTGARLDRTDLTNANLTGAMVAQASFRTSNLSAQQLYSTASYQQKNLQGIRLNELSLAGWNFTGQDLRGAEMVSSDQTDADFTLADLRGMSGFDFEGDIIVRNTIDPDSILITLRLLPGETLVARAGGFLGLPVAFFGQFQIDPAATLDLTDNTAIVYQAPASEVRAQLISGRGGSGLGATWTGHGITSSTVAAANQASPEAFSLGYAENGSLPLGPYAEFHGFPVEDASVLVAYTRTGDANLDGVVNDDDVTIVGATYAPGVPQPYWALGDFDYNGFVDDDDVTLLGAFYDPAAAPLPAPATNANSVAAIPEPGTLRLLFSLAIVVLLVLHHRRLTTAGASRNNGRHGHRSFASTVA